MKNCIHIDAFLDRPSMRQLLGWAIDNEAAFQKAGVIGDQAWRESRVVYRFEPIDTRFRESVMLHAPSVAMALGLEPFKIGSVETQLTAHNDGDFFKRHKDSGTPETATRLLSFVYYFHDEPRLFTGGELFLGEPPIAIPVRQNSIIFFRSTDWHEVKPTACPSREWRHSRFTVNGWVRHG
jgi:SM-20-related protein